MVVKANEVPTLQKEFSASVCWLNPQPLNTAKTYLLQHGTQRIKSKIDRIEYVQDPTSFLKINSESVRLNEIAKVFIRSAKPLPLESYSTNTANGSFILIDEHSNNTVGVGFVD